MRMHSAAAVFAVVAAAASAAVSVAAAQSSAPSGTPKDLDKFDYAPGFGPDPAPFVSEEAYQFRPYGAAHEDSRGNVYAPINEFAGQTQRADPGALGGALGEAKRSILGIE